MLRPWKMKIQLDPSSNKAIYLQIADAIIGDVRSGRLQPGMALPGSRTMAQDLGLNRNTIVDALNVLLNEGWLISRERSGTFVADILPLAKQSVFVDTSKNDTPERDYRIQFDDGYPDSRIAPVEELARAYRQFFNRKAKWQMMGYGSAFGDLEFRIAITQMLNQYRGMSVDEQAICITRGSQMAMYLISQCLFDTGDYVLVENPGYKPAWEAIEKAGAVLLPVQVDNEGLVIDEVIHHLKSGKKIKAIYTTPHRQYPTTVTLSLSRRMDLVRLSNEYGFTIIEDDYDNEFHFGYRPVLPLASFSELTNYVYLGTMSKVVAPVLRIGYLVSHDRKLMEKVGALRKIIDVQGDVIMEQAVLQLISDGTIRRHLKKAATYYKAKRDYTDTLLQQYLADKVDYVVPDGGLAIWITAKEHLDWLKIAKELMMKGVKIVTPDYYSTGKTVNGIRLGYGALSEQQLKEGIIALSQVLHKK